MTGNRCQKYMCGLDGEGNGKGPKSGPGVEWYGGDAAAGRVSVLLATDCPSPLSRSTKIIKIELRKTLKEFAT